MDIRKLNQKNILLLVILGMALVSLFGGYLVTLFTGPTDEQMFKVLNEKGPKLKVEAPAEGAKLKPEFDITGKAKVPGQYIRALLKDAKGGVLQRQTTQMKKRQLDWSDFKLHFAYKGTYRGKAALEIYWLSHKDGSRQNEIKIPVTLE
ncbi:MAG: Gmad2 immunoglobulin-like domain-containing protein [Firmicutes bacterium]|nr:Gmad2 immunoglobulin-like domain-containing protein [Bacillota bacterium]